MQLEGLDENEWIEGASTITSCHTRLDRSSFIQSERIETWAVGYCSASPASVTKLCLRCLTSVFEHVLSQLLVFPQLLAGSQPTSTPHPPEWVSTIGNTARRTKSMRTVKTSKSVMREAAIAAESRINWAERSHWTQSTAIAPPARFCTVSSCRPSFNLDPLSWRGKDWHVSQAAPFQWAAIFHKEDINFTKGHNELGWYDPSEKTTAHKLPCKISCAYCRSPIMDEGRNMILLYPTLIHFKSKEDKKKFAPTYVTTARFSLAVK